MNALSVIQAVAAGAAVLVLGPASAQTPAVLPVQGLLTDVNGAPIEGTVNARFAVYNAEVGGVARHTEQIALNVSRGLFTTYLGAQALTPLDLAIFQGDLWLGVTVGTDSEMPRFRLGTAPFAARAARCEVAGGAETLGGHPPGDFSPTGHTHPFDLLTGIPRGLLDGDDNTLYSNGVGLSLVGTTFSLDRPVVEGYARGVCYDTKPELLAQLDPNYAPLTHTHPFTAITGAYPGNLTVNGAVTTTRIAYSTPRTHYLSVGAEGFVPDGNVDYSMVSGCSGAYLTGAGGMTATIQLPDGARITNMTAYFNDTSASDLTIYLWTNNLRGCGVSGVGSVSSSGVGGYTNNSVTLDHVVNNQVASYMLRAYSAAAWTSTLQVKGVVLTYTLPEAP